MKDVAAPAWPASWNVTPHAISSGRYTDPAFARLEFQKLWSRVWQCAARLDEIQEPGHYTTYDIGDQSVFIVRVDDKTVKAFHNVCPHRGTALTAGGCGQFPKNRIMCPFHGWRWNLDGSNQFVLERAEFKGGQLCEDDVRLREVKHAIFAGFVFITFAADPQPFDEFIAPVRQVVEDLAIGDMHHYWWKSIPVPANWKVAQEAFFEGYHVPATHPQLEPQSAEVVSGLKPESEANFMHHAIAYDAWPNGHGRFYGGKKTPMAGDVKRLAASDADPVDVMAARMNLLVEGMDAMILKEDVELVRSMKGKPIPEGSNLGAEYVKTLYATAAAQQRPMPKPKPEILGMWGGEVVIFPNLMILPQAGNAMIYRVRPHATDPDQCIFEILSTRTYPAAVKPPRAIVQTVTNYQDPEQLRLIPRQDLGNIPRMQKGLHSYGSQHIWIAGEQEKLILNHHRELDRYLRG
jgi:phenylpropionate dioxygenase-like ring-hydroxylating dioxygenase large terminal subunit